MIRSQSYNSLEYVITQPANQVADDLRWAQSALETLTAECVNTVHQSPTFWQNEPPQPTAFVNLTTASTAADATTAATASTTTARVSTTLGDVILDTVCPAGCSLRGRCVQRRCRCVGGYTGVDCSIQLNRPPTVSS